MKVLEVSLAVFLFILMASVAVVTVLIAIEDVIDFVEKLKEEK